MGVKNNLRQLFLATPTSALTTFEKEGYVRHKNNLRQHVFMSHISLPPFKYKCSVYKEHPFEKRTQHVRYDKLHFLFPIPIFISYFQSMRQESFISYLHQHFHDVFLSFHNVFIILQGLLLHRYASLQSSHLYLNVIAHKHRLPFFPRFKIHINIARNIHNDKTEQQNT